MTNLLAFASMLNVPMVGAIAFMGLATALTGGVSLGLFGVSDTFAAIWVSRPTVLALARI